MDSGFAQSGIRSGAAGEAAEFGPGLLHCKGARDGLTALEFGDGWIQLGTQRLEPCLVCLILTRNEPQSMPDYFARRLELPGFDFPLDQPL